jgi:hypothetical protein
MHVTCSVVEPGCCACHAAGTLVQCVPGVLLPVCTCLDVLGAGAGKDCITRVLLLCLKGAVAKDVWQVRNTGCESSSVSSRPGTHCALSSVSNCLQDT